jgi:hypothetical protein
MMSKVKLTIIFLLLFGILAFPAISMVYYIDDKGVVHFVEDESLVPEKYQNRKRNLQEVGPNERENIPIPKSESDKKTEEKKEVIKDKQGNTPSYWRNRYKTLLNEKLAKEKELRDLEEQRDEVARRYESARSKAYYIGDSQSVTEAASLELKLRDLENMIKITIQQLDTLNKKLSVDIYEEILQAGGNPAWLLSEE